MSEPKNPTQGAQTSMKWRPLGSRVVVRQALAPDDPMIGSMYIPVGAQGAEAPNEGEVLSVGYGVRSDDGKWQPVEVGVGDTVMYGKYAGMKIEVDGEELLVLLESDLMMAHTPDRSGAAGAAHSDVPILAVFKGTDDE